MEKRVGTYIVKRSYEERESVGTVIARKILADERGGKILTADRLIRYNRNRGSIGKEAV